MSDDEEDLPVAYMGSDEQIFTPIATKKDKKTSEDSPCFLKPTGPDGHPSPTSEDLDPYFTPPQNDFSIAVSDKDDLNIKNGEDDPKEIRSVGLRGPLIIGGWAYTLTNRRVPSDEEFGENRNLWKTGPVDLRWDEQRKVYTCGVDILEGYLTTPITPAINGSATTFEMQIYRNFDNDIETNTSKIKAVNWRGGETIVGINRSSISSDSGKYIMVIRINYEYRPIWVDC